MGFEVIERPVDKTELFIADEVHEIGSEKRQTIMEQINFNQKLGLTATPERNFDPEGSQLIQDYFDS